MRPPVSARGATTLACFDMDGVLIDSEAAKISCWIQAVSTVLSPDANALQRLDSYNRSHRGVPRTVKFAHAARVMGADDHLVSKMLGTYAELLEVALAQPRAFDGSREFVRNWPGDIAVVSSAPEGEVGSLLGMLGYRIFDHIFGFPTSKSDALSRLSSRYDALVFFGDAPADRNVARAKGVPFVAIGEAITPDSSDLAAAATLGELVGQETHLAVAASIPCARSSRRRW